jgi:signal transduction histidine kinase
MVQHEMVATLEPANAHLIELSAAGVERIQLVFGPRSEELLEIAAEASAGLMKSLHALVPSHVVDDAHMRDLRHDLRGPVGTLRGAVIMLTRRIESPDHPIAQRAQAVLVAAEDLRDIVEALTEDVERE